MYILIWKYTVSESNKKKFENIYNSNGFWTQFFMQDKEFLGTKFFFNGDHYLTIDHWTSKSAYEKFKEKFKEEYIKKDKEFESLTETEEMVGTFYQL